MNRVMKMSGWMLALAVIGVHCTAYADRATTRAGYLGVSVEKLTWDDKKELNADFGALVVDVKEKSPADKAGIQEDDVIQYFDNKMIRRPDDLTKRVRETKPGTKVKIVLVRDSKRTEVETEIGRMRHTQFFIGGMNGKGFQFFEQGGCYLGVRLQNLNSDLAEYFKVKENEGVLITEVIEDSPAEKAGIKAGDVIVQLDNEKVIEPEDVQSILSDKEEGDKIEIALIRKGERKTVKVELEEKDFSCGIVTPDVRVHIPDIPKIDIQAPETSLQTPSIDVQVPKMPRIETRMNVDEDYRDFMEKQQAEKRNQKGLAALRASG